MSGKSTIARSSASEVRERIARGEAIVREDAPDAASLGADFWASARVVVPPGKASVHLRVDQDVLAWFRAQGSGHLTRMNAVLRAYYEAHKPKD
jgi:uncharacterized protein (DUF4415 family)